VTPEEQIETAYQAVQSVLRADLLDRIAQNSPSFFEQLIVDLLVAMGYGGSRKDAASQLGKSGDGGVDGVINEDRLSEVGGHAAAVEDRSGWRWPQLRHSDRPVQIVPRPRVRRQRRPGAASASGHWNPAA
jgi:hypothetical protein